MSEFDQLIDHAADLQRDVHRLDREVLCLALAGMCLAIFCLLMGWSLWRA